MRGAWAWVLLATVLGGCLDGDDARPDGEGTAAAAEATTWTLHGLGTSDLWMDERSEGNAIGLWGVVTPNQDPVWWTFPLRPAPDGLPVARARFLLEVDVEDVRGEPPLVETRLLVDGAEVARGSGPGGDLDVPEGTVAKRDLALAVCVCRDEGSVSYRYDLYLGGPSTLTMAAATPAS